MYVKKALLLPIAIMTACCALVAVAGEDNKPGMERQHVIALKTDDFELAETDISDLAVGESETIITDSGKTIDLLRTVDGFEVYVDGQLLDMEFADTTDVRGTHDGLHKNIEIMCTSEEDCDEWVWVSDGEDIHVDIANESEANHVITKEVIIECTGEEDCAEHNIWISEEGDVTSHVIRLHEDNDGEHEGGKKVIKIHKKSDRN